MGASLSGGHDHHGHVGTSGSAVQGALGLLASNILQTIFSGNTSLIGGSNNLGGAGNDTVFAGNSNVSGNALFNFSGGNTSNSVDFSGGTGSNSLSVGGVTINQVGSGYTQVTGNGNTVINLSDGGQLTIVLNIQTNFYI